MRAPIAAAALLAGALIALSVPTSPRAGEAEADVLKFFDDVIFAGKPHAKVAKWTHPPTVRLETIEPDEKTGEGRAVRNDPGLYKALAERVSIIAEASGLNMRLLPDGVAEGGDLVVRLTPLRMFASLAFDGVPTKLLREQTGPGRCFFLIWPNEDWSIAKAQVVINSLLSEDHIKHCFYEETVQSLGLPNDSDRLRPSIFNEQLMVSHLSDLDRSIIHALYDPSITPGLGRRETLDRVAEILKKQR